MPALRILQVEHMEKRRIQQRFYLFSGDGRSFHFFTIRVTHFGEGKGFRCRSNYAFLHIEVCEDCMEGGVLGNEWCIFGIREEIRGYFVRCTGDKEGRPAYKLFTFDRAGRRCNGNNCRGSA